MADYIQVQNYSKSGDLYISRKIFEKIAADAIKNVPGVLLKPRSKAPKNRVSAHLSRPIRISFRKNGRVDVDIDISLIKGAKAEQVCLLIQEEVSNSLLAYTESVPFNINVKVVELEDK